MGLKKIGLTVIEQTHRLTCHCEAVVIELTLPDGVVTPQRCNCSFCRRRGAIVADIAEENIRLVNGHDQLRRYQFRSHTAEHYFCGSCGIYTHHRRRSNPHRSDTMLAVLKGLIHSRSKMSLYQMALTIHWIGRWGWNIAGRAVVLSLYL